MLDYGLRAEYYDLMFTSDAPDVRFYVERARSAKAPVLEIACGTGRVLIPIAQAGVEIIGMDLSPPMLARARQKVARLDPETQSRITLLEGDMRSFDLGRQFDLIIIPFRAFLALMTPGDERSALQCLHRHLTDEGRLIFNIFDPNLTLIANRPKALSSRDQYFNPETQRLVYHWDSVHDLLDTQQIEVLEVFEEVNEKGEVVSRKHLPFRLRYLYRYEMQYLLELCGFQVESLWGDFAGGPFRHGGEQVWVARKGLTR